MQVWAKGRSKQGLMRMWRKRRYVDDALRNIAWYMENGGLPSLLLKSYQRTLANSGGDLRRYFYEQLPTACPAAVILFKEVQDEVPGF